MRKTHRVKIAILLGLGMAILGLQPTGLKADDETGVTIHVVVTDAETGKPINQARLTLQFEEETRTMMVRHSKPHSYSAKTNPQGQCRFRDIPKGTVRLMVTAERHMSFGKDIEINQDDQKIEVKLKKPQPQL